jgi:hypothetical protein
MNVRQFIPRALNQNRQQDANCLWYNYVAWGIGTFARISLSLCCLYALCVSCGKMRSLIPFRAAFPIPSRG